MRLSNVAAVVAFLAMALSVLAVGAGVWWAAVTWLLSLLAISFIFGFWAGSK